MTGISNFGFKKRRCHPELVSGSKSFQPEKPEKPDKPFQISNFGFEKAALDN